VIRFARVSFAYGGTTTAALRDVSFEIERGSMVAVLGANGSGKSTLARLMNGLLRPSSGTVEVDGIDTSAPRSEIDVRSKVAMVFQNPDDQIVATSVEDDIAFGPENLGLDRAAIRRRVDAALGDTGLAGLERREPHLLSGGQRQRLAIAGALAMQPDFLVLDEPTSMIDEKGRREVTAVLQRVRERGQAVVLVTHDLSDAMRADSVMVLSHGEMVFQGDPAALLGEKGRLGGWGLELTPLLDLAERLRASGLEMPPAPVDASAVVEALCR
jgi:energy-coupling factor transport system ATP-binding protein